MLWLSAVVGSRSVAGGAPNPTQSGTAVAARTRKLPHKHARVYKRWHCPRPCVYAWQRWRAAPRLSARCVRLFHRCTLCPQGKRAAVQPPAAARLLSLSGALSGRGASPRVPLPYAHALTGSGPRLACCGLRPPTRQKFLHSSSSDHNRFKCYEFVMC